MFIVTLNEAITEINEIELSDNVCQVGKTDSGFLVVTEEEKLIKDDLMRSFKVIEYDADGR